MLLAKRVGLFVLTFVLGALIATFVGNALVSSGSVGPVENKPAHNVSDHPSLDCSDVDVWSEDHGENVVPEEYRNVDPDTLDDSKGQKAYRIPGFEDDVPEKRKAVRKDKARKVQQ